MKKKPFVAQTSLVPVLACVAALLFSANFYQFLQKNFKKWWGWDFSCPIEQVDCHRHEIDVEHRHHYKHRKHHQHRRHRHDRPHRHDEEDRHTIILNLERERELDRVQDNLDEAQRKLERNLERAMRDLERLHERMEWDALSDTRRERLETEVRIKAENLRNLERVKRVLERRVEAHEHRTQDEIIQEFHFDDNIEIRIRKHH